MVSKRKRERVFSKDTIGRRFIIAFIVVIVILLALALYGYLTDSWEAQAQPVPPSKYDERIKQMDIEAIENAYKGQIVHLFEVWMKSAEGQPGRALTGARNARRAYIGAMTELEKH